jgi:hypothetical protein
LPNCNNPFILAQTLVAAPAAETAVGIARRQPAPMSLDMDGDFLARRGSLRLAEQGFTVAPGRPYVAMSVRG